MTGHNHYANCTCGWCVKYGGKRIDRSQVAADLRRRDAAALLEHNAVRSFSACYVNPNARCPACGAGVFYYANQHGSRAFFDAQGHPWPKHPCTDHPAARANAALATSSPPLRRPRGMALELAAAASTAGLFDPQGGEHAGWRLLVVIATESRGDRQVVAAESLDVATTAATFSYQAPAPLIAAGDFVSRKGNLISFLNRETLAHMTFRNGEAPELARTPADGRASLSSAVSRLPPASVIRGKTALIRRSPHTDPREMTEAETAHFHSKRINVAQFCDRLAPVVKSYARAGTRKPHDVAVRLNLDGHTTASGAPWTPRLARFLLALIFAEPGAERPKPAGTRRSTSAKAAGAERPVSTLTSADLALRLSALGRVSFKGKP